MIILTVDRFEWVLRPSLVLLTLHEWIWNGLTISSTVLAFAVCYALVEICVRNRKPFLILCHPLQEVLFGSNALRLA